MLALGRLASSRIRLSCLSKKSYPLLRHEQLASIHMVWPEPVTLPTIIDFLDEINYYEDARKIINIGIEQFKVESPKNIVHQDDQIRGASSKSELEEEPNLDKVLQLLGKEIQNETLNFDQLSSDWICSQEGRDQLARLATHFGIYRDLFTDYKCPKGGSISFTKELAEKFDRFVPHYWITDLPFSKVPLKKIEEPPMYYFDPVVPIIAKFVSSTTKQDGGDDVISGHVVYHGNYIQACDANQKPSISLDGRILSEMYQDYSHKKQEELDQVNCYETAWISGDVQLNNFSPSYNNYLSLILLNLDTIYGQDGMLHWMITNLQQDSSSDQRVAKYDEVCEFLPVYGMNGFGHSRYVFVLFEHSEKLDSTKLKINSFSAESRRFKTMDFFAQNQTVNLKPVGLSWFQTAWDDSSNVIFHDYLKMRAPQYEHVLTKNHLIEEKAYPGRVPFNIYLDVYKDKKDINKRVLLERLKRVDPFGYKDQYLPPIVPADIHREKVPDWMSMTVWKKNNKLGYWRGLRPASALLPLNNNADLDQPCRPLAPSDKHPFLRPNPYPGRPKIKKVQDLPHSKIPINEQPSVYIHDGCSLIGINGVNEFGISGKDLAEVEHKQHGGSTSQASIESSAPTKIKCRLEKKTD